MPQPLVNFLIVGTQKGGTTALANFLATHPDICMAPVKEVHFFDYDRHYLHPNRSTPNWDYYHSFFPNYTGQPAVGEATPIYMYLPWIAPRLHAYNPNLKLIAILRHPIDRAYSQYQMEYARGWETLSFAAAIAAEPRRLFLPKLASLLGDRRHAQTETAPIRTHSYCDRGHYARQIRNLLRYFPRQNLLVLRNEDLQAHHTQVLQTTYRFLGVRDDASLVPAPARIFARDYAPLAPELRSRLQRLYKQGLRTLSQDLGICLERELSNSQVLPPLE